MKNVFIILLGLFVTNKAFCFNYTIEKIEKYVPYQENTLMLPTDFAGHIILNPEDAQIIQKKKIYHIDLVYTQYKTSPTFNQKALNKNRVDQLKKCIPQIKSDQPSWTFIEQTGAKTSKDAKDCFHGFVLHFSEELDHKNLNEFFSQFQTKATIYTVKNSDGGVYSYNSGTTIHIPKNAVVYNNGSQVEGTYEIVYREFRNPADILFSGIPMTYKEGETEYNFSSVGMYEIHAYQNGEELKLNQPVSIDFNCTNKAEGVAFYQMDKNGGWSKDHQIDFIQNTKEEDKTANKITQQNVENQTNENIQVVDSKNHINIIGNNSEWSTSSENGNLNVTFDKNAWKTFCKIIETDEDFKNKIVEQNEKKRTASLKEIEAADFNGKMIGLNRNGVGPAIQSEFEGKFTPNNMQSTLLAEGSGDKGHTYPALVKGLNSKEFGVYNCDQIYRIGKSKSLAPQYVDAISGEPIKNKHVVCVLDLNYNGSFSFHPDYINCNAEGKNVILLFTDNKEVYMLNQDEFAILDLEDNYNPVFKMTNMTSKIKTSEDLKEMLNL